MKNKSEIKKNWNLKGIVITILVILLLLLIGIAYARYITKLNGQITASVANWTLKINDATENEQFAINLAQTKDTQKSKSGNEIYVEPGDQGVFDLVIDAEGTGVSLVYNLDIDISAMPKNLILYADEQMIHKIPVVDNSTSSVTDRKIKLEDYIGIDSNSQTQTKRIYWQWPFESGTSDVEITENDIDDSRYMGDSIEMSISISSKQINEEPIYLAKKVSVGDLVNYNANVADANGNTFATPYTYTTDSTITGSTTQATFSSADSMTWKVLYKNEQFGIVELVSTDGTENDLGLYGRTGFTNALTILNNISSIYGNGYGAICGRSIAIDDVEQYSNYNKLTYTNNNGVTYGETRSYISGKLFKEISKKIIMNETIDVSYDTNITIASDSNPIEMTQNEYHYVASSYYSDNNAYKLLFKKTDNSYHRYWIAFRCVDLKSGRCSFCIKRIYDNEIGAFTLVDGNSQGQRNN